MHRDKKLGDKKKIPYDPRRFIEKIAYDSLVAKIKNPRNTLAQAFRGVFLSFDEIILIQIELVYCSDCRIYLPELN